MHFRPDSLELISWQTSTPPCSIARLIHCERRSFYWEMRSPQRPSLLALSALLLCTLHQTAQTHRFHRSSSASSSASSASSSTTTTTTTTTTYPSESGDRNRLGTQHLLKQTNNSLNDGSRRSKSRPSSKLKEERGPVKGSSFNSSDGSTVGSKRSDRLAAWRRQEGPLCAYRVIDGGVGEPLCFRHTLFGFKCHKAECSTVVSVGNLEANILANGSVLLQWTRGEESSTTGQDKIAKPAADGHMDPGTNVTERPDPLLGDRQPERAGYELNCWWNGSYTQFECAGVHLGSGCRDFLLTELHENIPYRICLRSLGRWDAGQKGGRRDCVEFTLPPSGMQDIVIAMTTVGGAICVMLVIICLLVAYITENLMSPATQHTYYQTHSRH
ncbi:uncharacterized protein fndc10 [Spinachia spinachia]